MQPQAHELMHLGRRPRTVDEPLVQVVDRQVEVLLPIVFGRDLVACLVSVLYSACCTPADRSRAEL